HQVGPVPAEQAHHLLEGAKVAADLLDGHHVEPRHDLRDRRHAEPVARGGVLVTRPPAPGEAAAAADVPGGDEKVAVVGLGRDGLVERAGQGLEITARVGGRRAEELEVDRQRVSHAARASWALGSPWWSATRGCPGMASSQWASSL